MAAKRKKRRAFEKCAVIYLRYSTHNQTDLSIEYQREITEKYCADKGYTVVKHFIDEAKSGTTDKRDSFQAMIAEAHNEPPWSKIIVFSFNRFARNKDYDSHYKIVLMELGITIESATQDNSDTPQARLVRNVTASFDAYQPECCAVHTHAAMLTKAKKCEHCGGTPPLGFDVLDKKLVINEYEAETVRLIFDMYDKNYSYNAMIKVLDEQGRTTKCGSSFKKTSFNSILKQEKYKGTFVWNRAASKNFDDTHNSHASKPLNEQVRVDGGCAAIVDEALFNRVQDKMNDNRKSNLRSGGKRHYMLGGMSKIYCAECGSAMVGAANKSHGKTHRYYVCPKHKPKSCKLKNLRADYLEKLLCVTIVNKTVNTNNYTQYNALLKELVGKKPGKGICRELAGVKKAIDNILKVLETHPTDEAMEHFSSLTAKKDALKSRLDAVNNVPQITPDNLKNLRIQLAKELKNSSDPLTYDIIDKIVKRVTVGKDNIEIELHI